MIEIGLGELAAIAIAAIIFLKPEDIPRIIGKIGKLVGQFQQYMDSVSKEVQEQGASLKKSITVESIEKGPEEKPIEKEQKKQEPTPPAEKRTGDAA
jgi:Sec-independent protein translocase protein TatA